MVTIAILTYNRKELLEELLLSLLKLQYKPMEIIVVDNHSTDGTQEMLEKKFPTIKHLRTQENIGVGARNLGLKCAKGEIVITLDDDVSGLGDEEINNLVGKFRSDQNVGAVNFKVLDHMTGQLCNWVHHCRCEDYCNTEFLTYEITEGAVAFRKCVLEEVGYYSETFFLSHEGPDLAFRILDKGYSVIFFPAVAVIHSHSDLGRKSWLRYYYDTRNLLWLAARNLPFFYALRYLVRGLLSMGVYSLRDGFFLYWVRGIIDGCKGIGRELQKRKPMNDSTMKIVKAIDDKRPDLRYIIRKRLFKKSVRL